MQSHVGNKKASLTGYEKGQIDVWRKCGESCADIATRLGRGETTVRRFLKDPEVGTRSHNAGRKRCLTDRDERLVKKLAVDEKLSCGEIAASGDVSCSKSTIVRCLAKASDVTYGAYRQTHVATDVAHQKRMDAAAAWLAHPPNWEEVIFSDEKKFYRDGPKNLQKGYSRTGAEPTVVEEHWGGGFGVMVWGAIGVNFKSELAIIKESINAPIYTNILRDYLLPKYSAEKLFLQDNAASHKARESMTWLEANKIAVLPFPPYSPDLNIIENVWGIMTSNIYKGGRQFVTMEQLECAILDSWALIDNETVIRMARSMPHRLRDVIDKKGNTIDV